eukprot:TRINITY_DN598_c0_g2_i1.p1 TRINITY_DN598_c0_g2~~TRINITY_DN598_c0_g2_i1.p1  ORF type:complete len:362 (-),score=79.37 TRINITY_DN598_c0_g2_i1:49-1134(-)
MSTSTPDEPTPEPSLLSHSHDFHKSDKREKKTKKKHKEKDEKHKDKDKDKEKKKHKKSSSSSRHSHRRIHSVEKVNLPDISAEDPLLAEKVSSSRHSHRRTNSAGKERTLTASKESPSSSLRNSSQNQANDEEDDREVWIEREVEYGPITKKKYIPGLYTKNPLPPPPPSRILDDAPSIEYTFHDKDRTSEGLPSQLGSDSKNFGVELKVQKEVIVSSRFDPHQANEILAMLVEEPQFIYHRVISKLGSIAPVGIDGVKCSEDIFRFNPDNTFEFEKRNGREGQLTSEMTVEFQGKGKFDIELPSNLALTWLEPADKSSRYTTDDMKQSLPLEEYLKRYATLRIGKDRLIRSARPYDAIFC